MPTPFQSLRNSAHHARSDLKPLFRRMRWCISRAMVERLIIRRKNVRPGFTTQQACWRCPIRDSSRLFVHDFFPCHFLIIVHRCCNLSSGRQSSSFTVSRKMPRNCKPWHGPSTFSAASGTPSCWQASIACQCRRTHSPVGRTQKQEIV